MTEPITEADLARLDALCAAATEGPWEEIGADNYACSSVFFIAGPGEKFIMSTEGIEFAADVLTGPNEADVAFIAASRTALPALVAALRAAWRERDEALEASDNGWRSVNRLNHDLALVMVALNEVELEHFGATSIDSFADRICELGKILDALRNDRERAMAGSVTDPLLTEEYRLRCALNAIANFREISVREHGCTSSEIMWWMVEQARSALSATPNEEKNR